MSVTECGVGDEEMRTSADGLGESLGTLLLEDVSQAFGWRRKCAGVVAEILFFRHDRRSRRRRRRATGDERNSGNDFGCKGEIHIDVNTKVKRQTKKRKNSVLCRKRKMTGHKSERGRWKD